MNKDASVKCEITIGGEVVRNDEVPCNGSGDLMKIATGIYGFITDLEKKVDAPETE